MNRQRITIIMCLTMLVIALFASGPPSAQAVDEKKIPHYFGPYPNWALSQLPVVTTPTGNAVTARSTATDGAANVFVVNPTPLPAGTLTGFKVYDQPGSGPNTFNAYVLRGTAPNYQVVFDSGPLTVPAVTTGQELTFSVPGMTIQAGDLLAHYGPGIPIDIGTGADGLYYPANTAPVQGSTIALGGVVFPAFPQARTYSIAAMVAAPTTVTGGIKKFQDGLPLLCNPSIAGSCTAAMNNLGQYLPLAVPDTTTFTTAGGYGPDADYIVIALVQHRERMSSSLHPTAGPGMGTLLREYVQLETPVNASWSRHVALMTDLPDGTSVPVLMPDGSQAYGVDDPHYLGPLVAATKDRPVRIVFYNLLPKGSGGNLFLPVDSSMMGSGMGPMNMMDPMNMGTVDDMVRNPVCTDAAKGAGMDCFKDNRATLHLHGGITPWISDGTPHQWITPANESTPWPQGVSVGSVPDMNNVPGVPNCSAATDGCSTFYYTNQQSARLMFYHDHAWGITRLNVYAGEAAGYLIADDMEKSLINSGLIPADQIPLVIQDRTFVPDTTQMAALDPTWDYTRWGKAGDLWYHHVYMPAQNPGDLSGVSAYGRWMYGPWFWPPATPQYPPIANPYYNMDPATGFTTALAVPCDQDIPSTWQYQVDPFCEPALIPGTPNISVGMEQFNDTPIVNGTAYPTTTVDPKSYRLRILNAANDRFFNLQWYVADATGTEVALKATELAAAQLDPNIFPTPDTLLSPVGPSWIQIGSEGGFLPAPVVIPNQPITWIIDPTRFDVGNVDQHSLALAPAERADVIVDFSQYAGKTLILYNDAPAAYPARVASYDYYTGAPDLSPVGAPYILPGYGPNTRTVMQVKVAATAAAAPFNLPALEAAFKPASTTNTTGIGVFQNSQHPIIVGQSAYNSAYGTTFASNSWCNVVGPTINRCDGLARIFDQGGTLFGFNTLFAPAAKMQIMMEPKALHDEMNAVAFDEFGRMTANIGIETVPATPANQNVTLYPYVNPSTELIDATNLPKNTLTNSTIAPISTQDGTQIWKITHNGVDTHPIHFHLYDVQLLNRVTWDNIIIKPDANELGWKDTVRVSPLEDTIVALRPVIPALPFEIPNSIRPLNPMMPIGSTAMFNNIDVLGIPTTPITNQLVNFGWEYVWHCHILSHEEMDMMRPVSVAVPPKAATNLTYSLTGTGNNRRVVLAWNDNSISETGFLIQNSTNGGTTWTDVGSVPSPLNQPNTTGPRSFTDPGVYNPAVTTSYRVVAQNMVGYGGEFPSITATSVSAPLTILPPPIPNVPSSLTAVAGPAAPTPAPVTLTWMDNSAAPNNETGFTLQRSTSSTFAVVTTFTRPAVVGTGTRTFVDTTVAAATTYYYRILAFNANGSSAWSNTATVTTPGLTPAAPANLRLTTRSTTFIIMSWNNVANEQGFYVERSPAPPAAPNWTRVGQTAANTLTFRNTGLTRSTNYLYRVQAFNAAGASPYSNILTTATLP